MLICVLRRELRDARIHTYVIVGELGSRVEGHRRTGIVGFSKGGMSTKVGVEGRERGTSREAGRKSSERKRFQEEKAITAGDKRTG